MGIDQKRGAIFLPWKQKLQYLVTTIGLLGIFSLAGVGERTVANSTPVLSESEISQKLQQLPGWTREGNKIVNTFKFKDFVTAVDFVNQLVEPAESTGHHPELAIAYNRVTVSLTTHDAGGITERDFALARVISRLADE
ncbi:4a-hydroxytetrahydrobiopterin dehydratase [Myxosarcina sp. GI1(2024)]